jgi:hypothetical protein
MRIRVGNVEHVLDWQFNGRPDELRVEYISPARKEILRGTTPNPMPYGAYQMLLGKSENRGNGTITCPAWVKWRGKVLANESGDRRYLVVRYKTDPLSAEWVVTFDSHIPESLVLQLQLAAGQLKEVRDERPHPRPADAQRPDPGNQLERPEHADDRPGQVTPQVKIKEPRGGSSYVDRRNGRGKVRGRKS